MVNKIYQNNDLLENIWNKNIWKKEIKINKKNNGVKNFLKKDVPKPCNES